MRLCKNIEKYGTCTINSCQYLHPKILCSKGKNCEFKSKCTFFHEPIDRINWYYLKRLNDKDIYINKLENRIENMKYDYRELEHNLHYEKNLNNSKEIERKNTSLTLNRYMKIINEQKKSYFMLKKNNDKNLKTLNELYKELDSIKNKKDSKSDSQNILYTSSNSPVKEVVKQSVPQPPLQMISESLLEIRQDPESPKENIKIFIDKKPDISLIEPVKSRKRKLYNLEGTQPIRKSKRIASMLSR